MKIKRASFYIAINALLYFINVFFTIEIGIFNQLQASAMAMIVYFLCPQIVLQLISIFEMEIIKMNIDTSKASKTNAESKI